MHSAPFLLYAFLSNEYYENIDRYGPSGEYRGIVQNAFPDGWHCQPKGFWTGATPPGWEGIAHGWKIHLSSTVENAKEILGIAAPILVKRGIAFKFCSDEHMLWMSLGKAWPRSQTGKFVTIYPRNEDECRDLLESLLAATSNLVGPHILTDRAYRGSRVVHYRYGAHASFTHTDPYGHHSSGFFFDDGSWQADVRGPKFTLPPGITDPFHKAREEAPASRPTEPVLASPQVPISPKEILLAGRYLVKGALKFNASGGIYFGIDQETGREIIIRESRGMLGHLESEMPEDPAFILRREGRILQALSDTGYVPAFIALFKEWNNWFLVVERLDAISLWGHSMEFYFSSEDQSSSFGLDKISTTVEAIAQGLIAVHERGIVLRDLTRNNIMFTRDGGHIKFIDLEFAYELADTDPWLRGWTPGYASVEQAASARPSPDDDLYAFGVLILDMLTFSAAGLELDRESIFAKLRMVLDDLGLSPTLYDIVRGLTDEEPARRWTLTRVIDSIRSLADNGKQQSMLPTRMQLLEAAPPCPKLHERIVEVENSMLLHLDAAVDFSRTDRLWPASPEVFLTNPVSVQYGASGTALFQLRSRGHVDGLVLDWIETRAGEHELPPGLYSGTCGVALLLADAGRMDSALRLTGQLNVESFRHSGLYFGLAGWGLTNLHLWVTTGHDRFLQQAIRVGELLLGTGTKTNNAASLSWPYEGQTYLGLGDGQSGIALFLTYLAAATADPRYSEAAGRALEFDIAHGRRIAGRTVWTTHVAASDGASKLPHTRFGSAGIGSACIRHFALTGEERFRDIALDCAHTVRTRMSNKIWQDEGNAGYGEFFLDLERFLSDPRFGNLAYYQAEAILCHALERPTGVAFAGIDHYRICWDFAAGGAGIGVFLHRLRTRAPRFLMLDTLLDARPCNDAATADGRIEALDATCPV